MAFVVSVFQKVAINIMQKHEANAFDPNNPEYRVAIGTELLNACNELLNVCDEKQFQWYISEVLFNGLEQVILKYTNDQCVGEIMYDYCSQYINCEKLLCLQ